jgi:hypothetical protein
MADSDKVDSEFADLYKKVLWGSFEEIDMDKAVKSVRLAVSRGMTGERDLFHVLLCTNDPGLHREALSLARKNIDDWGRLSLFRMYFNGVGTERDIKAALHTLYYDDTVMGSIKGPQFAFIINRGIFTCGDIVLCGTIERIRTLFCVCADFGVRPDYYICPGKELPGMFGKPCPKDGKRRCYIRFSADDGAIVGPGAVFLYHPYGEESDGGDSLLRPRSFPLEKGAPLVPRSVTDLKTVPRDAIVDTRILNEAGHCVSHKSNGDLDSCRIFLLEIWYRIGEGIYRKMKHKGGRFLITSFFPMGDNYRWLAKYEGIDYSDVTMAVTETARDHPFLQGVDGALLSRGEIDCIRVYLSMIYHEDRMIRFSPYQPLYPGNTYHGNLDTKLDTGEARRLREPALSVMGAILDVGRARKRVPIQIPRTVLLNPYGNSIKLRSEEENARVHDVMLELSRKFLERGYLVFTNTPLPEQKELPGTKRYGEDIITTVAQAASFDLIVTVFTGFMETVMYSKANLVVLNYSREDTRRRMAKSIGHDNYWELNVLDFETSVLASKIIGIMDNLPTDKPKRSVRNEERIMNIQDKSALFKKEEINMDLAHFLLYNSGKGEIRQLVSEGTNDPLLCCVGGLAMERGVQVPVDVKGAITWYRRAFDQGVVAVRGRIIKLKEDLKASETALASDKT